MNYKENILYTKSHEWVRIENETLAVVGLTDYAQRELGSIVYVNMPQPGDEVSVGTMFADLESIKAASEIFSPVSGVVEEVNEELLDSPEIINEKPYETWIVKIGNISDKGELLDAKAYEAFIEEAENSK